MQPSDWANIVSTGLPRALTTRRSTEIIRNILKTKKKKEKFKKVQRKQHLNIKHINKNIHVYNY